MIEILSTGLPNTVQDGGRPGYLDAGVSLCGAMDRPALLVANALLGNDLDAAVIEVALFPFRLHFHAEMSFAVTGAMAPATLDGVSLPPWWTAHAKVGQELRIDPPSRGARVVVGFAGGVDVPRVLGSRATDLKGGFGGFEGRGLRRGDRLAIGDVPAMRPREFGTVPNWLDEDWGVLRVLPAAEFDAFDEESLQRFFDEPWTVSADANRQGYRLEGGQLVRASPRELFSHGIMPGTVQVPASGVPIIQLADANTCGGYPKIASVIEADLWKLAQAPVGAKLRFQEVTRTEGIAVVRAQRDGLARLREAVRLARG